MKRMIATGILVVLLAGCGSSGETSDGGASSPKTPEATTTTTSAETTTSDATTTAPEDEVTSGTVTVLANEYGLPDTTGWDTAVVFDLTNNGTNTIAVPYRVKIESEDGQTTATSDGTDSVVLGPEETVTVVLDSLDATGPSQPTKGTVTVYGRTGQESAALVGAPDWTSADEAFECDNGLVGCGFTGDLTYNGSDLASPGQIQVVVYDGDRIVAAGHPTTEVPDVAAGQTIPYAGQIAVADDFDGTSFTTVKVAVAQAVIGD